MIIIPQASSPAPAMTAKIEKTWNCSAGFSCSSQQSFGLCGSGFSPYLPMGNRQYQFAFNVAKPVLTNTGSECIANGPCGPFRAISTDPNGDQIRYYFS